MNEIDFYDKPIFKLKIRVGGLSKQRIDETINQFMEDYKDPNYHIFFVPIHDGDSNMECIYNPYSLKDNNKIYDDGFDPSKPAFQYKINIAGLSKQRAEAEIADCIERNGHFKKNIFYIPVVDEQSDVECIYNPI